MPFDFNKLMADPLFQQGLATLGGATNSPGLMNAYNAMQQRRKMELQAQEQEQQRALQEEQAKQAAVKSKFMEAQIGQVERKLKMQEEQRALIGRLFPQLMGSQGGDSGSSAVPIQPQQPALDLPPLQQPAVETGKYGTPKHILANLKQVESSGNPNAIGPDIGGGVRAQGAFQFLPSTINELKKEGIVFNPFNAQQSEDAADYYIQKLVRQHGGDYSKALAAYGGFRTKDPSSYISKVMAGSPEAQARQHVQNQAQAQRAQAFEGFSPELKLDDDGGMSITIKPDYERQRIGVDRERLNMEQQRLLHDRARVGFEATRTQNEVNKESRVAAKDDREAATKLAEAKASYNLGSGALDRLDSAVSELIRDPGLKSITGLGSLTNKLAIPGGAAHRSLAKLESIKSKLVNDTLQAIRSASANGASGYGQFTEKELGVIQTYVENLDPGRADFVESLQRVQSYVKNMRETASTRYEESTGQKVRRVVRTGKDKSGKRVVQYSDGSIEHAD